MFRRRTAKNQPQPTPLADSDWNPTEIRNALFKVLDSRLGKENGKVIREDFDKHIAADPRHGVEQAYVCLLGKLIEYTDALNDEQSSLSSAEIAGVNAFSVFRKQR